MNSSFDSNYDVDKPLDSIHEVIRAENKEYNPLASLNYAPKSVEEFRELSKVNAILRVFERTNSMRSDYISPRTP